MVQSAHRAPRPAGSRPWLGVWLLLSAPAAEGVTLCGLVGERKRRLGSERTVRDERGPHSLEIIYSFCFI